MMQTSAIKFILNEEIKEVEGISPTVTVLEYLRQIEGLTGTKEGCAEGDCGACTAILAEYVNGAVHYKPVNTCILFLPAINGKELITVEYFKNKYGQLHPVQKEMVSNHGSQCGFCTPGFVMSLICLFENVQERDVHEKDIHNAIAGNLCRCTGYRPIIDAANFVSNNGSKKLEIDISKLESIQDNDVFSYEFEEQLYFAPKTVSQLVELLDQYPKAYILAGGTDIGLWVTKQNMVLNELIYIGDIEELKTIESKNGNIHLGAFVTYQELKNYLDSYNDSLNTYLQRFASAQIRSSATVGGNLANGSPIGDGMPALIALGAKIHLKSAKEERQLALEDFYIDYGEQDLRKGEFLERITFPVISESDFFRTYKVSKRFDQDISAVAAGFYMKIEQGRIVDARLAYGGMAATPKRAVGAEQYLEGKEWSSDHCFSAMKELEKDFSPIDDMRASSSYRMNVAKNLLYRFYLETSEQDVETTVYEYGS